MISRVGRTVICLPLQDSWYPGSGHNTISTDAKSTNIGREGVEALSVPPQQYLRGSLLARRQSAGGIRVLPEHNVAINVYVAHFLGEKTVDGGEESCVGGAQKC